MRAIRMSVVGGVVLVAIAIRTAAFGELKIVGEILDLFSRSEADGLWASAALICYYVAETLRIVLLLLFAQRAGTSRFAHPLIPSGGLILALTWGVMHILLQGPSAALYAMFAALLYGLIVSFGPRSTLAVAALVGLASIA